MGPADAGNNVQILTVVLAFVTSFLAVLTGVLLNNSRLSDIRDLVNVRVQDAKTALSAQIDGKASSHEVADLRVLIEKNHSELLLKFAEMDNRLNLMDARLMRIEGERRIVQ